MFDIIKDSSVRIKTAILLFLVFILVSYIDSFFVTWLYFGLFMIIGISEAMNLFKVKSFITYQFASVTWICAYFYAQPEDLLAIALVVFGSMLAYNRNLEKNIMLALIYPLGSFLFLLALYSEFGIQVLWWLLFIVGTADIGAYYVGRRFGKTKFSETSPNKTLEGVAGGLILASLLGPLFAINEIPYFLALIISLFVGISSVFGDLFESYLKREAGVKDSGDILPGHGGILDRTDGFLFASVIMLVILRAVV
ncbi:MAG: phosphatidate cytidylyltransferase [Campylobacterales bacterium]|nr:phosphatidate cytidylyltransferase [Campylobacterales bacterium]